MLLKIRNSFILLSYYFGLLFAGFFSLVGALSVIGDFIFLYNSYGFSFSFIELFGFLVVFLLLLLSCIVCFVVVIRIYRGDFVVIKK